MQIYELISCYFAGLALSVLALFLSGTKKKKVFSLYIANSVFGLVCALAFIGTQSGEALSLLTCGAGGVAGAFLLCVFRVFTTVL